MIPPTEAAGGRRSVGSATVLLGLLAVLLAVGAQVAVRDRQPRTYTGTHVYLVATAAGATQGEVSINSDRAARDYAHLLASDDAILAQLGASTGLGGDHLRDRLSSGHPPRSSTIAVRYAAPSRDELTRVFAGLDDAIAQGRARLPAGALRPLGRGSVEVSRDPLLLFAVEPAILGLLAGMGLALVLRRSRPAVTTTRVQAGTERSVVAVHRPADLGPVATRVLRTGATHVTVVGASGTKPALVEALLARLAEHRGPQTVPQIASGPGHMVPSDGVAVLLAASTTRLRHLERAVSALEGVQDVVIVLANPAALTATPGTA